MKPGGDGIDARTGRGGDVAARRSRRSWRTRRQCAEARCSKARQQAHQSRCRTARLRRRSWPWSSRCRPCPPTRRSPCSRRSHATRNSSCGCRRASHTCGGCARRTWPLPASTRGSGGGASRQCASGRSRSGWTASTGATGFSATISRAFGWKSLTMRSATGWSGAAIRACSRWTSSSPPSTRTACARMRCARRSRSAAPSWSRR